jgi:hypothetical protein
MLNYGKLFMTTAVALVAMFTVAGSAMASEATVSPAGAISAPSTGQTTFTSSFSTRCNLTLNGSLLRGPIRTESTSQIGEVTEVTIARETCEGGTVEGVLNVPWRMTLTQTLGTAPNAITGLLLTINNVQFLLSVFGGFVDCLYEGDVGALLVLSALRTAGTYRTGNIAALNSSLSLASGGFGCPSSGSMSGTFTVTAQTITVV